MVVKNKIYEKFYCTKLIKTKTYPLLYDYPSFHIWRQKINIPFETYSFENAFIPKIYVHKLHIMLNLKLIVANKT